MDPTATPVAKTAMLIRRPVAEVFEAFVEPEITSKFWFSKGSERLQPGGSARWEWAVFGVSEQVRVVALEPNRRLVIEWPGSGTTRTVEWRFKPRADTQTLVEITESGFAASGDELVAQVADSTAGFNLVLAGLKAYLEHGIQLNLVADRFPDGPPGGAWSRFVFAGRSTPTMPSSPSQQPAASLGTARLRLTASTPAFAAMVLAFQRRNAERFARWDPPLAADFLTLRVQQQRLRRDARAFGGGTHWRWWLQLHDRDDVVGQVHVSQVQRGPFCSAMLGYAVDDAHEGRGLMSEALRAVMHELFSPAVNLHRLQAGVRPENARSLALLQRLGFTREGLVRKYLFIDGAWRDHVLMARVNPAFVQPDGW